MKPSLERCGVGFDRGCLTARRLEKGLAVVCRIGLLEFRYTTDITSRASCPITVFIVLVLWSVATC